MRYELVHQGRLCRPWKRQILIDFGVDIAVAVVFVIVVVIADVIAAAAVAVAVDKQELRAPAEAFPILQESS